MHTNNLRFLKELKEKYPTNFIGAKVLELGSGGVARNQGVRTFFENCDYTGIDIVSGVAVDIVVAAKKTQFQSEYFDTLMCFSMFEHDPDWKESFAHNIPFVKKDGLIALCWGAERNQPHGPAPWKIVPVKEFMDFAKILPIKIIDNFFEEEKYNNVDCPGAYDVVARRI